MGDKRNSYKIFVGNPEGKLLRHRRRWEGNINTDFEGTGCSGKWNRLDKR